MKLCFATNNAHKIEEVKALLGDFFQIVSLSELGFTDTLREDYDTLEENASQKAQFVHQTFNVDCFADDSGLEVYALNLEPGVLSARYAGDARNDTDNIDLLLKNLHGQENRKARFRTVISLILNGKSYQFEGVVEGKINVQRKGSKGFGYDPVFIPEGYVQTFAEMELKDKNSISHRARAVEKLVTFLRHHK